MRKVLIKTMALGLVGFSVFLYSQGGSTHSSKKNISVASNKNDSIIAHDTDIDKTPDETNDLPLSEKVDYLKDTTYKDEDGKTIVKNTDDILILANKKRNLSSDYKPKDLVIPNVRFPFKENLEKKYLRKEAADALEELFKGADEDEITLYAVSGYRSYNTQKSLFDRKVKNVGFEEANKLVAFPGQSEHQTGLAMDVSCKSVNFTLEENFGQAIEGKWLKDNAHRFGFIIRFQKETTEITGYSYEPWHIRYVGKEIAKEIYEKNITLEEFLGDI